MSTISQHDALLRAMDFNCWEMYRDNVRQARGGELFETPSYYLGYAPRGTLFHNLVMLRGRVDVDAVFADIRRFYGERAAPYTIWLRAHADPDTEAALRARGFAQFTAMPGMALLADPGTACAPNGLTIRAVADDIGRADFARVSGAAYATYGAPAEYADDVFASIESVCAPHIQAFLGYRGERAVAGAIVYVTHGVAGIGWVGTLPEERGHGYGEAVTWAAIREGFRRGASLASLQASPMGRPIYERMGFITPTEYRVLFGVVD
jgi:hypothetical protein